MKSEPDHSIAARVDKQATQIVDAALPVNWEKFVQQPDYFCDFHLETRENDTLTGDRIYVQQKGQIRVKVNGKTAKYAALKMKHVRYWVNQVRVPVFVFLVDTRRRTVWWLFVQKYFLEEQKKWWEDNHKRSGNTTVHIPVSQTLDQIDQFTTAIAESLVFMQNQRPGSIHAAVQAEKKTIETLDPRFGVTFRLDADGQPQAFLNPKDGPVEMSFIFKGSEERREEFLKYGIEYGQRFDIQPGEIEFTGSPLFSGKNFAAVQFGRTMKFDLIAVMTEPDGRKTELNFRDSTVTGGTAAGMLKGSVANGVITVTGEVTMQRLKLSFEISLKKWRGLPAATLPYFNQIKAFVLAHAEGRPVEMFIEIEGNRSNNSLGSGTSKSNYKQRFKDVKSFVLFLTDLRMLCEVLCVSLIVPTKLEKAEYHAINEVCDELVEGTFPANGMSGTCVLTAEHQPVLERLRNGEAILWDFFRIERQCQEIMILGVKAIFPDVSQTYNAVEVRFLEQLENGDVKVKLNGTETSQCVRKIERSGTPPIPLPHQN